MDVADVVDQTSEPVRFCISALGIFQILLQSFDPFDGVQIRQIRVLSLFFCDVLVVRGVSKMPVSVCVNQISVFVE